MKKSELTQLIREEVRKVIKENQYSQTTKILKEDFDISPIKDVKTGDKIWRLMSRYNPQLGDYYVFSQVKITRVNANSISCDDNAIYSRETGKRKGKQTSVYGSSDYMIMSNDDAKRINDELTKQGKRVRGFK